MGHTRRAAHAEAAAPYGRAVVLQRKCGCGQHTIGGGKCDACAGKKLDRPRALASANEIVSTPGSPLDEAAREFMESRFSSDFSGVRVHTDGRAAESARSLNAHAYTIGRHIVFGAGLYSPESSAGRRLLAHELTHTLQQGTAESRAYAVGDPLTDAGEREAESVASRIMSMTEPGDYTVGVRGLAPMVQREVADADEELSAQQTGDEMVVQEEDDVYDGDVPVNASTAPPESVESESETEMDFGTLLAANDAGDSFQAKGGGGGQKPKAPAKPSAPPKPPRKITKVNVDLAAQTATLEWSDGTTEGPHKIASGRGLPNTKDDPCKTQTEENCTPAGDFTVGRLGDKNTENKKHDRMSWYVGFVDSRGIGIHNSQPVHGVPESHGCVRVGDSAADDAYAKKINQNVMPGKTVVHVFGKALTKPWKKAVPKPKKGGKK
jgi:hypothetical protein